MDPQFPKWLRIVLKLDFLGIPNLAPLICGLMVLAFWLKCWEGAPYEQFIFDQILF